MNEPTTKALARVLEVLEGLPDDMSRRRVILAASILLGVPVEADLVELRALGEEEGGGT